MNKPGYSEYQAFLETNTKLKIEKFGFVPASDSISKYTKKLFDKYEIEFFNSNNGKYALATIHYLGFDSTIYKRKIGALNILINPVDISKDEASSQALLLVDQLSGYLKTSDYELIICRLPLEHLFWIQTLEKTGFTIMDVQCPLLLRNSNINIADRKSISPPVQIRDFRPDDIDPIISFGKSAFGKSHLYADPYLPLNESDLLHEMWLKNDCTGRAEFVLTSLDNNVVNGFIACLIDHDQESILGLHHGHIDLISVIEGMQGKGIGKLLMQEGLIRFSEIGYDLVTISTQATNLRAINLYQKIGFVMSGFEVTLHGWFKNERGNENR